MNFQAEFKAYFSINFILTNNQLDAQLFLYIFISILYMFRATLCSSSGESIVSIQHLDARREVPSRPTYRTVTYTE
jgi:hypothetical protein